MEDLKDRDEQISSIKLDLDIEELESRIAPRLSANHNETMLRDSI